jgi:uncharacterized protein
MTPDPTVSRTGVLLRAGLFLVAVRLLGGVFFTVLGEAAYFAGAAVSGFLSGVLASVFAMRVFERGRLTDLGLTWNPEAVRQLWIGLAAGFGAAVAATLPALVAGWAFYAPSPAQEAVFNPGKLVFVLIVLLFGAIGEELMFRGYAFQTVLQTFGNWTTILPFSILFAVAHMGNLGSTPLSLGNTFLWGVVFSVAYLRTRSLWLPIGLHTGWNWALPGLGVNLSGFELRLHPWVLEWRAGDLISGGAYGVEASILTTFAAGALLFLLLRYQWTRNGA